MKELEGFVTRAGPIAKSRVLTFLVLLPYLVSGQLIDHTNTAFDKWKGGDLISASKALTDVGFTKISKENEDLSLRSVNGKLVITICKTPQETPILIIHTEFFSAWRELMKEFEEYCEAATMNKYQEIPENGLLMFYCGNRTYLYRKVDNLYMVTVGQRKAP